MVHVARSHIRASIVIYFIAAAADEQSLLNSLLHGRGLGCQVFAECAFILL
jgi:hypothetical protein